MFTPNPRGSIPRWSATGSAGPEIVFLINLVHSSHYLLTFLFISSFFLHGTKRKTNFEIVFFIVNCFPWKSFYTENILRPTKWSLKTHLKLKIWKPTFLLILQIFAHFMFLLILRNFCSFKQTFAHFTKFLLILCFLFILCFCSF